MELIKVSLKDECIDKLREDRAFRIVIQLCRMVNILRGNLRLYLNISDEDRLLNVKDSFDLILIHCSLLYEAMKEFSSLCKDLKNYDVWNEYLEDIKIITRESGKKDSFTNTILSKIRNEIIFHFAEGLIEEMIEGFDFRKDASFLMGKSDQVRDVTYILADNLIFNYLIKSVGGEGESIKRYEKFIRDVLTLSDKLCTTSELIMKGLLRGKIEFAKVTI